MVPECLSGSSRLRQLQEQVTLLCTMVLIDLIFGFKLHVTEHSDLFIRSCIQNSMLPSIEPPMRPGRYRYRN